MRIHAFATTLAGFLLLAAAGCSTPPNHERRPAKVSAAGKVVFIPPRCADSFYFDTDGSVSIARAASLAIEQNASKLRAIDFTVTRGPLRAMILEDAPTTEQWARIAAEAGADYLVHAQIDSLNWLDPMDTTLPRCTFTITYSVVQAAGSREIYRSTVSGVYPAGVIAERGVTVFDMGMEGLQRNSYQYMGTLLARTFYRHTISIFEARGLDQGPNMAAR